MAESAHTLSLSDVEVSLGLTCRPSTEPDMPEALELSVPPEGGSLLWRGAGRKGELWPKDKFLKDKFLVLPVRHQNDHALYLHLRFFETGSEVHEPHTDLAFSIFPNFVVQVVLPLTALDLRTLFLPPTPGRMKSVSGGVPADPAKVTALRLTLPRGVVAQTLLLGAPYLTDAPPAHKLPAEPVVDALGQWLQKHWRGKTKSETELVARLRRDAAEPPAPLQGPLSRYGGWAERQSDATGFFRTEQSGGRWWLVDPDGHPFFSVGPDCVSPRMPGPVGEHQGLFYWLPPRDGPFRAAWSDPERPDSSVCFSTANLLRAFGESWHTRWRDLVGAQLRAWGFNTVANWSEPGLGRRLGLPYVTELPRFPTTQHTLFRGFPDVFSPAYEADAARCARALEPLAEDPLLIGYFLRNEPEWAFGVHNLAEYLLAHDGHLSSKAQLIHFLAERYGGDITCLSGAWAHPFASFEELKRPLASAARLSPAAAADLDAFNRVLIETYIRVPAEAARRVAPNHLNLGLRWAWVASDAFYAGSEHCDVFSINAYRLAPDAAHIAEVASKSGKPVMIGEFHAGALDAGLPSTGLRAVKNQRERGVFYRYYVEQAAAIPDLVGVHYFQWGDQPVLGRFDGENCQIGLVDICHQPYEAVVEAVTETHRRLYRVAAGLTAPFSTPPCEVPVAGFGDAAPKNG